MRLQALHARRMRASAFSIVELLVVLAIIVILIAILLPVISRAREGARSVVCLSNLQQCDHLYQIYLNANHNHSFQSQMQGWRESLAPGTKDINAVLLCPDGRDPNSMPTAPPSGLVAIQRGSASSAWVERTAESSTVGSYGFNWNLLGHHNATPNGFFILPAPNPAIIPVLSDSIFSRVIWASTRDTLPTNLVQPDSSNGMSEVCLDRHSKGVNVAFLDGHAEHVALAGLWRLKWSPDSLPRDVIVP